MTSISELKRAKLADLERLFVSAPMGPPPVGSFRGTTLARLDSVRARSSAGRLLVAPFEKLPFGVDFTTKRWFFVRPTLQMGSFQIASAPSRWRETSVLALHYDRSRLPRAIKRWLYDEIKPLSETLCLGLGGINAADDSGALFFFALELD